jgi:tol-pal system protein YbgF
MGRRSLSVIASSAALLSLSVALPIGAQTPGSPTLGGAGLGGVPGAGPGGGSGAGAGMALGGGSVEVRLDRLERMLSEQTLSDLVLQIQRLQQEVQDLRGQVEVQQYRMQQMDRGGFAGFGAGPLRPTPGSDAGAGLGAGPGAEGAAGSGAAGGIPEELAAEIANAAGAAADGGIDAAAPIVAPPPQQGLGALGRGSGTGGTLALPSPETTAGGEREAYRAAFDLLKDRKYPQAKQEFTSMLARYPQGQFADNGLYWLGEIGYVTKDYPSALIHFNRLVSDYPLSPKVPGAMLKLGYVYSDQQDFEQARRILTEVAKRFPDTTEGRLAQGRLEQMTRDGG